MTFPSRKAFVASSNQNDAISLFDWCVGACIFGAADVVVQARPLRLLFGAIGLAIIFHLLKIYWPSIKLKVGQRFTSMVERITSNKLNRRVFYSVLLVVLLASVGFRVSRHFHSSKTVPGAASVPHAPLWVPTPIDGWAQGWGFKPPDLATISVDTSTLRQYSDQFGIMSIVRVKDDRIDINQDRRIVKSGVFRITSNPIVIDVPLDPIIAIRINELGVQAKPKPFLFTFEIVVAVIPLQNEVQAANISTIRDVIKLGGNVAATAGFTQSLEVGLKRGDTPSRTTAHPKPEKPIAHADPSTPQVTSVDQCPPGVTKINLDMEGVVAANNGGCGFEINGDVCAVVKGKGLLLYRNLKGGVCINKDGTIGTGATK